MIAVYDFSRHIATFDFYSWLVTVAAKGATEIVFDVRRFKLSKWSEEAGRKRYETICRPGPKLLGIASREGHWEESEIEATCHMSDFVAFVKAGNKIPRLKALGIYKGRATVTIRECGKHVPRNSNRKAWDRFAREIGALVIEDYDVNPISIHDRMALYAGAEMNYGVVNGPMHLVALSDYPMTVFGAAHESRKQYLVPGEQYPWCGPHQRLVWETDDYDNMMRAHEKWFERQVLRA